MTRFTEDHGSSKPKSAPRQGWQDAFRAAGSAAQDELLLDPMPSNEFDLADWNW
jgi:hypothetical protein